MAVLWLCSARGVPNFKPAYPLVSMPRVILVARRGCTASAFDPLPVGLVIGQVFLVLSFVFGDEEYQCALVHWFVPEGDVPDPDTGMWVVEPDAEFILQEFHGVLHDNYLKCQQRLLSRPDSEQPNAINPNWDKSTDANNLLLIRRPNIDNMEEWFQGEDITSKQAKVYWNLIGLGFQPGSGDPRGSTVSTYRKSKAQSCRNRLGDGHRIPVELGFFHTLFAEHRAGRVFSELGDFHQVCCPEGNFDRIGSRVGVLESH
ncbi:hypothetical protein C8R45DRAFT_935050 [Mycena sanguinolenta]|nr:hypothetical protein C8R45DRAFT_935050 [Mycena sanguinolenta]